MQLCFIDYGTPFEEIRKKDQLEYNLEEYYNNPETILAANRLYSDRNNFRNYTKLENGVRQRCAFSQDLFDLHVEAIL